MTTPTETDIQRANNLRHKILARTGLTSTTLQCPRESSPLTPCLARDGGVVLAVSSVRGPICVGCETTLDELEEQERRKTH